MRLTAEATDDSEPDMRGGPAKGPLTCRVSQVSVVFQTGVSTRSGMDGCSVSMA